MSKFAVSLFKINTLSSIFSKSGRELQSNARKPGVPVVPAPARLRGARESGVPD